MDVSNVAIDGKSATCECCSAIATHLSADKVPLCAECFEEIRTACDLLMEGLEDGDY